MTSAFPRRTPANPWLRDVAMPYRAALNVLGTPTAFESNRRWLLRLAEHAYAGLPSCGEAGDHPQVGVRLLANDDQPAAAWPAPPAAHIHADDAVVGAVFGPGDAAFCVPELGRALVTVSPAMRQQPYHVRYELIEFACYAIVPRRIGAVGLHAACIARDDSAFLVFGHSGAGKSTLTFACLVAGWDLIAEDSAFVTRAGAVRGVPTFIHLMDDALGFFPGVRVTAQTITRRSGRTKHEVDVRSTFGRPMRANANLAGLVFLDPARAHRPRLHPITPAQVRRRVLDMLPFGPSYEAWPEVLPLLLQRPAYVLTTSRDLSAMVKLLDSL
jgi:hypothetical protein